MKSPRAYCFRIEYWVRCASELRCWSVLGDERAVETRALRIWWQQRAHRSTVGCDSIATRLSAAFRPLRPRVRLAPECLRATRQSLNGQRPSGAHHDRRFLLKASNGPLTRPPCNARDRRLSPLTVPRLGDHSITGDGRRSPPPQGPVNAGAGLMGSRTGGHL